MILCLCIVLIRREKYRNDNFMNADSYDRHYLHQIWVILSGSDYTPVGLLPPTIQLTRNLFTHYPELTSNMFVYCMLLAVYLAENIGLCQGILELSISDLRFHIGKSRIMCNSTCLRPSRSHITDLFHIGDRYEISCSSANWWLVQMLSTGIPHTLVDLTDPCSYVIPDSPKPLTSYAKFSNMLRQHSQDSPEVSALTVLHAKWYQWWVIGWSTSGATETSLQVRKRLRKQLSPPHTDWRETLNLLVYSRSGGY